MWRWMNTHDRLIAVVAITLSFGLGFWMTANSRALEVWWWNATHTPVTDTTPKG